MSREDLVWILAAIILLIVGFLVGQRWAVPRGEPVEAGPVPSEAEMLDVRDDAFRVRFWRGRSLDLAVQAALVLVGALSIAALLPRGREDEAP
ncbi:MAG TPA: hypothetical protein VM366_00175 [Anaerolineae bacterium]|nr:hypothetical protein [Anaerolineae bacterium]